MVSIGTLAAFCVVCAAVGVLRRTQPALKRPFRAPFSDPAFPAVPALGVLLSFANMCALPGSTWLRLFAWMCVGGLIYVGYARGHAKPYEARRAALLGLPPPAAGAAADGAGAGAGAGAGEVEGGEGEARRLHAGDSLGLSFESQSPLQLPGAPPRPGEGAREGREGREGRESRESRAQRLGAARAPARADE
jgi:C-terminus of AA_permease